jgi:3-hydroxy acid dehydrogenase / malonic semialdehyde reductase
MAKIAIITGATSGIGEACAYKFAQEGWDLVITGRRQDRLKEIENIIRERFEVDVLVLSFDVRELLQVKNALNSLEGKWTQADVLINNAGLAVGKGPIQEGIYEDWERMIDTNIKGLLYMSREIAPMMIKNGHGHIINIASLAGHESYPGGNVYCATKHAVRSLTRGMRMDLVQHGIKVSVVSPGAADTEFSLVRYKGDKEQADKTYEGFIPLKAEDIAESVFFIASQPPHVNIEEIFILPSAQASSTIIHREEVS